jgi:hypothetical protein
VTDNVNHPAHYTHYKGLEIIELTEQMNFNLGNAVKYIARAGLKNPETEIEDLEKAIFYVERELKRGIDPRRVIEFNGKLVEKFTFSLGELPLILASQMKHNRGSAVKGICLGDTWSLNDALGYLGMEIEELKNR